MTRKRSPERNQFLQNLLLDTQQGTRHWATVEHADPIADNDGYTTGYHKIVIADKETGTRHAITADTIATGLNRLLRLAGPGAAQELRIANRTNGQEGDYGPHDVDMAVQCGLFGEVVYT